MSGAKPTIAFIMGNVHGGGAEYVARTWIAELQKRGFECVAYTYEPVDRVSDITCEVRAFQEHSRALRFLKLPFWIQRQTRLDSVDIVVSMLTYTNIVAGFAKLLGLGETRLFISERNLASAYLKLGGRGGRLQAALARILYRRSDGLIAISHAVAADAIASFQLDAERVHVVQNPVTGTRRFQARPAVAAETGVHLVYVGRLVEQKAAHRVVEVMRELSGRGVAVEATFIGKGPLEAEITAAVDRHGLQASFIGWQEPWWEHPGRPTWSALLLPSHMEGFGNVLVEAAAVGLPSVACSSALGVSDAIVPGLTGEFAISTSARDIADAVLRATRYEVDTIALTPWLEHFGVVQSVDSLLRSIGLPTEARHAAPLVNA